MDRDATPAVEPQYDCLWPLGLTPDGQFELAPRLNDLAGKTVAELWDYLFHGEVVFARIREELTVRYPGIRFVGYDTFGSTNGPLRADILARMPELLREHRIDAVISGIGA